MKGLDRALQGFGKFSLEVTWSDPALAALAADLKTKQFHDQVMEFWFTPYTRALPRGLKKIDFRLLPPEFHHYFETNDLVEVNRPAWQQPPRKRGRGKQLVRRLWTNRQARVPPLWFVKFGVSLYHEPG